MLDVREVFLKYCEISIGYFKRGIIGICMALRVKRQIEQIIDKDLKKGRREDGTLRYPGVYDSQFRVCIFHLLALCQSDRNGCIIFGKLPCVQFFLSLLRRS